MLANVKDAKIGVLMQNDDFGKDYVDGFKKGLGKENAGKIVKHVTYEMTDPTVDSQIIQLKDSGANVFFDIAHAEVLRPGDPQGGRDRLEARAVPGQRVGLGRLGDQARRLRERQGIITAAYLKDPTDKQWDNAEDMKAWRAWMAKNMPNASTLDGNYIFAHSVAHHDGRDAEALRRQPHARQRDEAGGELP